MIDTDTASMIVFEEGAAVDADVDVDVDAKVVDVHVDDESVVADGERGTLWQ
jgi:hypothetical protein